MRYEVYEKRLGTERIVTQTRREQGAVNERDIAIDSAYQNARKHADRSGGRAVQGPNGKPNEVDVVYWTDDTTAVWTYGYRRIGGEPEKDYTDALYASVLALNGATL